MTSEKKKGVLPRFELLLVGVFFTIILIWGVSRCGSARQQYIEEKGLEQVEEEPPAFESPAAKMDPLPPKDSSELQTTENRPRTIRERYTPLFVTVDGMNVRSQPKLNASIVARLKLFDEVIYLNEVTDFQQEINLGDTTTVAPWVKIKTQKGKVGWIYGVGVHYYKTKLEGVTTD